MVELKLINKILHFQFSDTLISDDKYKYTTKYSHIKN